MRNSPLRALEKLGLDVSIEDSAKKEIVSNKTLSGACASSRGLTEGQ